MSTDERTRADVVRLTRFLRASRFPLRRKSLYAAGQPGGGRRMPGRPHDHARNDLPKILQEHDEAEPPAHLAPAVLAPVLAPFPGAAGRRHGHGRERASLTRARTPP